MPSENALQQNIERRQDSQPDSTSPGPGWRFIRRSIGPSLLDRTFESHNHAHIQRNDGTGYDVWINETELQNR